MQNYNFIKFSSKAATPLLFVLVLMSKLAHSQKLGSEVSPYCDYLLGQAGGSIYLPTFYGGSPFNIFTKSLVPEITAGSPVQVTIGPFSKSLNFFNFTDFILYATPVTAGLPELDILLMGAPPQVGVFQLFDKYRAGAGGMMCNPVSGVDDSVGAFEDRLLTMYKQFYPNNQALLHYTLPARNQVSVLWWPTKAAMTHPEIKFVANLKSMGKWFKIQSNPWKVNKPVDHWTMTENMLTQFQNLQSKMGAMERRIEQTL